MSNSPYSANNVRRSLIHFIFGKTGSVILSISVLLVVVRVLPAHEYGIYIVMLAMLELVQLGSNFGIFAAVQRYVPELRAKHQGLALKRLIIQLTSLRIATLILVCLLLYYFMPSIAAFINAEDYTHLLRIYMLVIAAEGVARYIDMVFDSLLLQGFAQISLILRSGLRLLGVFLVPYFIDHDFALSDWVMTEFWASTIALVFSMLQLARYCNNVMQKSPGEMVTIGWSRAVKFIGPNFLAQIIALIYGQDAIKLIIQKLLGPVVAGAFGFSSLLVGVLLKYLPIFLLIGMLRPLFVAVPKDDPVAHGAKINELANMVLKMSMFTLLPLVCFLLLYRIEIIALLSGGKFPEASEYMWFFSMWLVLQVVHFVIGLMALAFEDGFSVFYGTVFASIGVVAGVLLLQYVGVQAVGWGLVLSEVIWCSIVIKLLIKKGATIRFDMHGNAKIIMVAVITAFTTSLIPWETVTIYSLAISLAALGIQFLALLFFFKPFSATERSWINKMLPKPLFVW